MLSKKILVFMFIFVIGLAHMDFRYE